MLLLKLILLYLVQNVSLGTVTANKVDATALTGKLTLSTSTTVKTVVEVDKSIFQLIAVASTLH